MKAAALGKLGGIEVAPPNLGTDGCVRLRSGRRRHLPRPLRPDGQVTNDGAKQFKVVKPATEGACSPPSTTTTTTTTTTPTTTTTTTTTTSTTTTTLMIFTHLLGIVCLQRHLP